jgi:hypothetical protein
MLSGGRSVRRWLVVALAGCSHAATAPPPDAAPPAPAHDAAGDLPVPDVAASPDAPEDAVVVAAVDGGGPGQLGTLVSVAGVQNDAELLMLQSLQGVLAQTRPRLWIDNGSISARYVQDLRERHGLRTEPLADAWAALARFAPEVHSYLLYEIGQPSEQAASSLAGLLQGVAVDVTLEARAKAAGLALLMDVRGKDARWVLAQYGSRLAHGLVIEMSGAKPRYLRDLAAARRALLYFDGPTSSFRTEVARALGPDTLCFGWGEDELSWVRGLSAAGAAGVAADYSSNLSTLSFATEPDLTQRAHDPPLDDPDGVHYVAFVMSDGDNIQWLARSFVDDTRWWGSPLRGRFSMTWEMAPVLAEMAPSFLRALELAASHGETRDFFVAGPSGLGYMFPSRHSDLPGFLARAAPSLERTDLHIVSVLNEGGGMEVCDAFLDRPEIDAVIYKDYADYNQQRGALRWRAGKPCLAHRYLLWDNGSAEDSPQGVAAALAARPRAPLTDAQSYSLVNVHAWSTWGGKGAMGAVADAVALLPPQVRVVTADQVVRRLRRHFGAP